MTRRPRLDWIGPVGWVAAPVAALAASAAHAVDYLSAEQAQARLFPEADRFETRELLLDAGLRQRVETTLGAPLKLARVPLRLAKKGGALIGVVVVDDVIGKFERITYAVGIDAQGTLRPVEILSYRESHGQEVRLPAWRKQFAGKTAASPLAIGEDIDNISGATLSCTHVTQGVRRIAITVQALREAGALRD